MPIDITLPPAEGVESADIAEVFVSEGDMLEKDQAICQIETGKATIDVPSPHAGKVTKIHIKPGQSVPIGGLLISIESAAGSSAAPPAPKPAPPAAAPAPKPVAPPAPVVAKPVAPVAPKPVVPAPAPIAPAPAPAEPVAVATVGDGSIPAGPAVRRFAREVGVELRQVGGSGEGGRITREDVLKVVREHSQAAPAAAASAGGKAKKQGGEQDNWGPVHIERMAKIRKTIALKMHESWSTVPRVTNFDDADVTELEKIRQSSKDDYAKKGIKLTSLPFVIKAIAMALRENPTINASIDMENDRIIYKEYVNIGIAVDTERGLVVPSLRNADVLSIPEIARAIAELAEKVRTNNFTLADLQGSTFTISNLGAIGGTYSTPIINTPEVAILLIGRSRELPVVVDGEVKVRLMLPLSLSYDHRLVDGATAQRFLNDMMGFLKAPSRLLLAP